MEYIGIEQNLSDLLTAIGAIFPAIITLLAGGKCQPPGKFMIGIERAESAYY